MSTSPLLRLRITIVALCTLFVSSIPNAPVLAGNPNQPFVRTANYYLMSGPVLDKPETIETLSQFDLIILPSEAQVYNQSFFATIRAKHPDIIILAYVPTVSWNHLYWTDPLHNRMFQNIQDSWWLREASGQKKSVWQNTTALNLTSGWNDYLATHVANDILATGLWDGVFYDEVQDSISWLGTVDVDNNHQNDTSREADIRWAEAYRRLFEKTRSLIGTNRLLVTNGSSNPVFSPYVNGRMFESFPSPKRPTNDWIGQTKEYLQLEKTVKQIPVSIINGNTDNTGALFDYKRMRFGMTTTLLGDGYFGFDYGTENHAQLWTYDEYKANLGSPLGPARDLLTSINRPLTASVYTRDYTGGKVIVNATDKPQTIQLPTPYEKIRGSQDPQTNNGSIVTRVTINPKDGVVLLKTVEEILNGIYLNGSFAKLFTPTGAQRRNGFFPFEPKAKGSNYVLKTDISGDNVPELIIADDTYITVYRPDGSIHAKFAPYTEGYKSGINFTLGNTLPDGARELVTGTKNGGGPQVRIWSTNGKLINAGFFAYDQAFRGGVSVATGDVDGDGIMEIVTGAGPNGGPHIRIFKKDGSLKSPGFFAYDQAFKGGVSVAVGDLDHDGKAEIVTGPGKGGGPHIRIFDQNGKLKNQFFAFETTKTSGVQVSVQDSDGDSQPEILVFTQQF